MFAAGAVIVGASSPGLHGVDLLSVMFAEITIIGTRIYQRTDIEAAVELITAGKVDAHRLISKIFHGMTRSALSTACAAAKG